MIEQIITSGKNVLAIEVIDGFTETDEKLCQKFFKEKVDDGSKQVHILVKLDEMKLSHTSIKAFMEDSVFALKNYKHIGHLAIVADSNLLKALVPVDNLFFKNADEGRMEHYFDKTEMAEALAFVNGGE
ncbi:STAS/SEC14 domain-containing protein [Tamlana sp. I1]|uniref:STAS/SEC14 domain-containing protein n=1 Tax=Tamlana sp. I1 TaxID=2762061 RepID=UPI0018909527|nr:STAS/SEC14 domain-containing protein [Tamlana sp. I1]